MKVKVKFVEGMLGTACANPEVHMEFIANKSADAEKMKAEVEALPADELMEKSTTVFPRTQDERQQPHVWDYQVKGFFKETMGILLEFCIPDAKVGKAKLSRWTYRKIVDNAVDVRPRVIPLVLPTGTDVTHCTRPLRAQTMKGERVALATSEEVPAGTEMEFEVVTLDPVLDDIVRQCLDHGARKGFGQWRNSGKGRFTWEEVK